MADLELLRSAPRRPVHPLEWSGRRTVLRAPPPRGPRPAQTRPGKRLQRIAAWITRLARDQGTLS